MSFILGITHLNQELFRTFEMGYLISAQVLGFLDQILGHPGGKHRVTKELGQFDLDNVIEMARSIIKKRIHGLGDRVLDRICDPETQVRSCN